MKSIRIKEAKLELDPQDNTMRLLSKITAVGSSSEESSDEDVSPVMTYSYKGDRDNNNNNERHGYGVTNYSNGDTHTGHYHHGLRHGEGTYVFATGGKYVGNYAQGHRDGHGALYNPDGSYYVGNWANNEKSGHGVYHYANKDVYKGDWSSDQRHGHGKYIYKGSFASYEGVWEQGLWHGPGVIATRHYRFVGVFQQGMAKGEGKYEFEKGYTQHGRYVWDKTVRKKRYQEELEDYLRGLHREDGKDVKDELLIEPRWVPRKLGETPSF